LAKKIDPPAGGSLPASDNRRCESAETRDLISATPAHWPAPATQLGLLSGCAPWACQKPRDRTDTHGGSQPSGRSRPGPGCQQAATYLALRSLRRLPSWPRL